MTEVYCPTCQRLLVRAHPDGSFDLAGQTRVSGDVPIPADVTTADLPLRLRTDVVALSARCLRCHPDPVLPRPAWWRRLGSWLMGPYR